MHNMAIDIQGLRKSYCGREVLRAVNLGVAAGEYAGLIGANGAGKTTLMKCLLDFCDLDDGSIRIFATHHRRPEARRRLAFLPERFSPPYYLSGREFLTYTAALHQAVPAEDEIARLCEGLELEASALRQPVRKYSQGMGQKLGLVACFLTRPDLLILDEPLNGLDPRARAAVRNYLASLKQNGLTLFYSTHLLDDVQTLCDRVIILHAGEVRYAGSVPDCCTTYRCATLEQAYLASSESLRHAGKPAG